MNGPLLTIRNAQMDVLRSTLAQPSFEAAMAFHLREVHPEQLASWSQPDLLALIRRVVERGRRAGIDDLPDGGALLELALVFGEDFFETQAWARPFAAGLDAIGDMSRADLLVQAAAEFLDAEQARAEARAQAVERAAHAVDDLEELQLVATSPDESEEALDEDFNNDDLSAYLQEPDPDPDPEPLGLPEATRPMGAR